MKEKEEGTPVDLCLEVLRRLEKARVLKDLILIGSWCCYFYKDYFDGETHLSALRTRDMDFLIQIPPKIHVTVDIAELLKDLGFIPDFHAKGFSRLSHPELIIDFLVPERGKGTDRLYPIKALGVNAQPLRFMDLLLSDPVTVKTHGFTLTLPDPILFAFHKLIVSRRRKVKEKKAKDVSQAVEILRTVRDQGQGPRAKLFFKKLPAKWQKMVLQALSKVDDLLQLLVVSNVSTA